MTCPQCMTVVDRPDLPHCVRTCPGCGRVMYVHQIAADRKGIKILQGDRFVIPSSWLKLSLSPLKSRGRFFKKGLQWFAELIFLESLPSHREGIDDELHRAEEEADQFLRNSPLLTGHDIDDREQAEVIIKLLEDHKDTAEWWAFLVGMFLSTERDAAQSGDTKLAVWATACAERARAMFIFKQHLEDVVWMGQSASQLIELLRTWDANKTNDNEAFWQGIFRNKSFALSQIFSVPVVFIANKAYVGGMNVDRADARFVDYLLSMESSRDAILVEIKTPTTHLLGSKYRSVYRPSSDLSGAVVQVLGYRNQLVRSLEEVTRDTSRELAVFNCPCVLLAGNGSAELDSDLKRKSFELFRSGLKDVDLVTYDELFRKLEVLASLFSLVRVPQESSSNGPPAA